MKPHPFRYLKPASVQEALDALADYGDDAKVLAGGQSLMPMMNMRLARPAVLVDINGILELDFIQERTGEIAIGAVTRQRKLETDVLVSRHLPVLPTVAMWMSHPQIRNRGTVVGSIVHGDPAAELPAAALALNAQINVASKRGKRFVRAADFYQGYFVTALSSDELAIEVVFQRMADDAGWGVSEVSPRNGDLALAGAVVILRIVDGRIQDPRVACYGLGGSATRVGDIEDALVGQEPSPGLIERIAPMASESVSAADDVNASKDYRRALAREVVFRALSDAVKKAHARTGEAL